MNKYSLKDLLTDHQTGHSEFQDDYLITIKAGGITDYGQYKQALRELYRRVRGLRELSCDYEKLKIEVNRESHRSQTDKDPFERRLAKVEHKRKTMQLEEAQRAIRDTKRELSRFYEQACELKEKIGDLTPEKRAKLDRDMWYYRLKEMLAVDLIATGRIGRSTLEFLTVVPTDMKWTILREIKQKQAELIDWYEGRHDNNNTRTDLIDSQQ